MTAQWTANTYTICYDANGGEGSMPETSAVYGQEVSLHTNTFAREGHAFLGWNTAADGSGESYTDGASVSNLTEESNGIVTLYAMWDTDATSWIYLCERNLDGDWSYWKFDAETGDGGETTQFPVDGLRHVSITVNPSDAIRSSNSSMDAWFQNHFSSVEILRLFSHISCLRNGQTEFYISPGEYRFFVGPTDSSFHDGYLIETDMDIQFDVQYVMAYGNGCLVDGMPCVGIYYSTSHPSDRTVFHAAVREGYTQLGWARNPEAVIADYPVDCTFKDLNPEDTELYAIWQENT